MTTYVNPSNDFRPMSHEMGRVWMYAGHHNGYIAQGATLVADVDSAGLTDGPHNAFVKAAESGLNVTIDTGEAVIDGAIVAKDTQTTVSLPPSSSPTLMLGWNPNVEGDVVIDIAANLTADVPTVPLYDFTTDTAAIAIETDQRPLGEHIDIENRRYETSDGSGEAVDNAEQLGGIAPNSYGRVDQTETIEGERIFNDRVTVHGQVGEPAIHVHGANATDVDTVVIDGDGDVDQDDDLFKVRGVGNPETETATNADTVFVTKGEGKIGINTHTPTSALDVSGTTNLDDVTISGQTQLQQNLNLSGQDITGVDVANASLLNTSNVDILEGGHGVIHHISNGRYFVAPVVPGESGPRYNEEFTYLENDHKWQFETNLGVNRGTVVASDTNRRIYVGNSFPSSAQNGDILFKPE